MVWGQQGTKEAKARVAWKVFAPWWDRRSTIARISAGEYGMRAWTRVSRELERAPIGVLPRISQVSRTLNLHRLGGASDHLPLIHAANTRYTPAIIGRINPKAESPKFPFTKIAEESKRIESPKPGTERLSAERSRQEIGFDMWSYSTSRRDTYT